jgi:ParB family transcriptional regulator, chromosome partitioning protein
MTKEPERSQRKVLGKGLSALLPSRNSNPPEHRSSTPPPAPVEIQAPVKSPLPEHFEEFQSLALKQIQPDEAQPREAFDQEKLVELSQSIRAHGVIQPITVRKVGENSYRIVAGERRWRAAQLAGLAEIPALVRTVREDDLLELALIENIQREDLNPIEIATAFHKLSVNYRLSHEQIAERTGKDRSTVTNFLRLLKLSEKARQALVAGEISMGHARAILNLDPAQQAKLCEDITRSQLSVREVENRVKILAKANTADSMELVEKKEQKAVDPNIRAALDEMAMALGTKVRLVPRNNKSGRLEIEYYSPEDLDRVYSVIVK